MEKLGGFSGRGGIKLKKKLLSLEQMSNKIIILQHTPLVTPGYFTQLMEEDLVETKIIRLDKGEKFPLILMRLTECYA